MDCFIWKIFVFKFIQTLSKFQNLVIFMQFNKLHNFKYSNFHSKNYTSFLQSSYYCFHQQNSIFLHPYFSAAIFQYLIVHFCFVISSKLLPYKSLSLSSFIKLFKNRLKIINYIIVLFGIGNNILLIYSIFFYYRTFSN